MSYSIDTKTLRKLALHQLPSELKSLRSKLSDDAITEQLLSAIDSGSIPESVFVIWVGVNKSSVVVRQALEQKLSIDVRHQGIAQLEHGLKTKQWEDFWRSLGGSAGLIEIFSDLSVQEVKSACKAIGRSTRDTDALRKAPKVTEFFRGLHPDIFPEAVVKTNDLRPLSKFYQELVPSCTPELVEWIISQEETGRWRHVREKAILKYHAASLEKHAMHSVFGDRKFDTKAKDRLKKLSTGYTVHRAPASVVSYEGFSISMIFALHLLRHIVESGSTHLDSSWILENIIRSLLRRAISKCVSWSSTQEIAALTVEYLKQQPSAVKSLTTNRRDVLHLVAICWSRRSALFEPHLKQIMRSVFDRKTTFEDIANLLVSVPKSRRYALLQLSCKEAMGLDLGSKTGFSEARGCLSTTLLNLLEPPEALRLFEDLREARGDVGLVDPGPYSSVSASKRAPDVREGDPDIYYLVLLNRNDMFAEAEAYAASVMERRKKTTATASNRERRAEHALSVWVCAHASGSLTLLSEAVKWARKSVRDQLTAVTVFSSYYDETYRLLSGFLGHDKTTLPTLAELHQRIEMANGIMLDLLDIACSAVREPHFRKSDWRKTLDLFYLVIKERLSLATNITEDFAAPTDGIYQALWADTIPMLLQVESILTNEEYQKLDAHSISGILDWRAIFQADDWKKWAKHAWNFVDDLAKARNDFWVKLRIAKYPAVLSLPEPFPRGLPVQSLPPVPSWDPIVPVDIDNLVPYISKRIKDALFINPEVALVPVMADKAVSEAIGPFVDDYGHALSLYVPSSCDKSERERRFAVVWEHLVGPLSERRMNREEAAEYWSPFMPYYLKDFSLCPRNDPPQWPLLPKSDDPTQIQEWNPLDGRPAGAVLRKARDLGQATYLDLCTLRSGPSKLVITSRLNPPHKLQLPEKRRAGGRIWQGSGPEAAEANALAALLYLDAKYGATNGLLSTPFPSADDMRYPCVYLDEEFLTLEELRVPNAATAALAGPIPLPLIHKVAETLVERLFSAETSSNLALESACIGFVRTLKENDRPSLAFDLALRIVIDYPKASSWHRDLFSDDYLNRLPASDARACIVKFAHAIGEKLNAMKMGTEGSTGEQAGPKGTGAQQTPGRKQADAPFIKITTLKSLAQLLNDSSYIGDDVSLEILTNFSRNVSHIDVRVSILRTLLSKLKNDRPELWNAVFSALETFIPIAGSMNERVPNSGTSEIVDGTLPEIRLTTDPAWEEESSMLTALVEFFGKLQDGSLLDMYVERIMVPLVKTLEEQTARWTAMFLRKYAKDDAEIIILYKTPIPKGWQIWDTLLGRSDLSSYRVPQALLDKYAAYLAFRISPPEPVREFSRLLEENPALRSTPEVKVWTELYGNSLPQDWSTMLPYNMIKSFKRASTETSNSHVTEQSYQKAFFKIFQTLVLADGPGYERLQAYVPSLSDCDLPQYKHTIEQMIGYVSSLRTREWERNPERWPEILPDVFAWRLLLLPYPSYHESGLDSESECKVFAQQVAVIVEEISRGMYHEKLEQIRDRVEGTNGSLLSALYLGDITKTRLSWLTTPDLLRIDLAAGMILKSETSEIENHKDRLKVLLDSWSGNENEEVRRIGFKTRKEAFEEQE